MLLPPSICPFSIFPLHFGPEALKKKHSYIASHKSSTLPPSGKCWQSQTLTLYYLPRWTWLRTLAHPLTFLKAMEGFFIYLWSLCWPQHSGDSAILMLFVTWGGKGGYTSRMRGSSIFHWFCLIMGTVLEFSTVFLQLLPSFCSHWFILFKLSHSACCQPFWLAFMSSPPKGNGS